MKTSTSRAPAFVASRTFAASYLWAQGRTIVKCEASNVQFRDVHSDVSNMDFFLTWRVGFPCWLEQCFSIAAVNTTCVANSIAPRFS